MWERLREFRLTPAGGLVSMLLVASLVVLLVGPRHDRNAALIVLLIVLLVAVGQAAGIRRGGMSSWPTRQERRAEFHARRRDPGDSVPLDQSEQDRLWQEERERYNAGS